MSVRVLHCVQPYKNREDKFKSKIIFIFAPAILARGSEFGARVTSLQTE